MQSKHSLNPVKNCPAYWVHSRNTPPEIINRLNLAARNAANAPSFVTRIEKEGVTLSVSSPEELSKLVRTERDRWRKVVTMARVTID
jgi:tripartite-type tricarboxylate transporter receptor subunit TctC